MNRKTSKLTPHDRRVRREEIMTKRDMTILAHDAEKQARSRHRLNLGKSYPRQSDRQAARYARLTGYVAPVAEPIKPKRVRKPKATAA